MRRSEGETGLGVPHARPGRAVVSMTTVAPHPVGTWLAAACQFEALLRHSVRVDLHVDNVTTGESGYIALSHRKATPPAVAHAWLPNDLVRSM